ncbi:hypothetical protein D3C77_784310 [compost metagenome]
MPQRFGSAAQPSTVDTCWKSAAPLLATLKVVLFLTVVGWVAGVRLRVPVRASRAGLSSTSAGR